VFMLSKYELLYPFLVPSTMAGNMRDALYPSSAKDDPTDVALLLNPSILRSSKSHSGRRRFPATATLSKLPNRSASK
jgi:hypothetical protein